MLIDDYSAFTRHQEIVDGSNFGRLGRINTRNITRTKNRKLTPLNVLCYPRLGLRTGST